jgi:hypothetical protein
MLYYLTHFSVTPHSVTELTKLGSRIFQTVDVVIDQTYALEPAEYKLATFLENINVSQDSCYSFVSNRSIWRLDKRIGASGTLGNRSNPTAKNPVSYLLPM